MAFIMAPLIIEQEVYMFRWGIIFLIVAVIAAGLGFGALSGTAAWAAKVVFIVGLILAVIGFFTGRKPGG